MTNPHENLEKNASEEMPQEGETTEDAAAQQTDSSKQKRGSGPSSADEDAAEGDGH